jgi:hypothetical protein
MCRGLALQYKNPTPAGLRQIAAGSAALIVSPSLHASPRGCAGAEGLQLLILSTLDIGARDRRACAVDAIVNA